MSQKIDEKELEFADKIKVFMDKSNVPNEIIDIIIENIETNYKRDDLSKIIKKLIEAHYIVPGIAFTKKDILDNQKRKDILQYIAKNPGIHGRAIRNYLKLGANEFYWHIPLLEKFCLIKRCESEGLEGFFLNRSYQDYEYALIWYQHPRSQKILKACMKVAISPLELSKATKMHYITIKKYIDKLHQFNLLLENEQDRITKYQTNHDFIVKLKKIINNAFFDDFVSE